MKLFIPFVFAMAAPFASIAGMNEDTISINFGSNSQIVIYLSDKDDLQLLQRYDINKMVKDLQLSVDSLKDKDVQRLVIQDASGAEYLRDTNQNEFQFKPEGFQKEISIGEFKRISVGDNFHVMVKKADGYKLILDGNMNDVEAVEISQSDQNLAIGFSNGFNKRGKVKVYIESPTLDELDLFGAAILNAAGFESQEFHVDISGAAKGQAIVMADKVVLDASGASRMKLIGKTDDLTIKASGASEIDASGMEAQNARVEASGASKIVAGAVYREDFVTSGGARIINSRKYVKSDSVEESSEEMIRVKIGKYEFAAPADVWEEFDREFGNGESADELFGKAKKEEYLQDETPAIRHAINFDFGMNNYLESGEFPDASGSLYAVRPWGSWYVGINSIHKFHIGGPFFLDWGKGISWYNFKFDDEYTRLVMNEDGIGFTQDQSPVEGIKSKLTVAHLNVSLVPMFDFSEGLRRVQSYSVDGFNFTQYNKRGFRIGVGGYAGYRIGSHTKYVFRDDRKEKEKDRGNFFLNNWRYGVRAQVGFKALDLFFNYDLSPMYVGTVSPDLNPFSFGVTF